MTKILVTGATGFVGKNLVPALVMAGHEVRCAVSKKVDWLQAEQVVVNKLEFAPDWTEALNGIDVVIHLAARVHVMQDQVESPLNEYCKINSIATKRFAEQAAAHQVKRFIFLSSIKVNGEYTQAGMPFTEESIAQPEDPYGQSKLYAEEYLQLVSQNTGMQIVILRPPLVYGPGVKANFLKMLKLVNKGWPLPFGKVHNKRHFIYIDNLVSALVAVITDPKAANQLYLVADDDSLSLPDLLKIIGESIKVKVWLITVPVKFLALIFKLSGLKNLNTRLLSSLEVSNKKIKTHLNWTPPVQIVDGLGRTAKWYKYDSNS